MNAVAAADEAGEKLTATPSTPSIAAPAVWMSPGDSAESAPNSGTLRPSCRDWATMWPISPVLDKMTRPCGFDARILSR